MIANALLVSREISILADPVKATAEERKLLFVHTVEFCPHLVSAVASFQSQRLRVRARKGKIELFGGIVGFWRFRFFLCCGVF